MINVSYISKEDLRIIKGLMGERGWSSQEHIFPWTTRFTSNLGPGFFINFPLNPPVDNPTFESFKRDLDEASIPLNLRAVLVKSKMGKGVLQLDLVSRGGS